MDLGERYKKTRIDYYYNIYQAGHFIEQQLKRSDYNFLRDQLKEVSNYVGVGERYYNQSAEKYREFKRKLADQNQQTYRAAFVNARNNYFA